MSPYNFHNFFIECASYSCGEFSVAWGYIVDAFIVNGDRYGKSWDTPPFVSYSLNSGETLTNVNYGVGLRTKNLIYQK